MCIFLVKKIYIIVKKLIAELPCFKRKIMLYFVYFLGILIINFLSSPYYFFLVFCMLKDKIKYYIFNISRFVFNFFWLADLVRIRNVQYLAAKKDLIRELPQSCEMMAEAMKSKLIFCHAKKQSHHDGCFYDPNNGKVIQTVQFKLKDKGSYLTPADFFSWFDKYSNLDRLDIGFLSFEEFEQSKNLIIDANKLLRSKGSKLVITSNDYSSYELESTCRPDIKDILDIQVSFKEIVTGVNENMMGLDGLIIAKSMFFV